VSGGQDVRDLLAEVADEPSGHTSPSIYESGRLVTLAPWLTGHGDRIEYLLSRQRLDGGWGPPDGYALVPTLSAT
jgi:halimadienyl-diphosphate synthase